MNAIEEFVRDTRKTLELRLEWHGLGSDGRLRYMITNHNMDSVPLSGWAWDDPTAIGYGETLREAFANFKREAEIP